MSGRFNPPPGWPVRQDWRPSPDWQPDPTWPRAPDGWQFWLDDKPLLSAEETAQPNAPASSLERHTLRRRTRLIVSAFVAGAVLIAGGVAAISVSTRSGDQPERPRWMLSTTYPRAPRLSWSVTAEQLGLGDSQPNFIDPSFGYDGPQQRGAIVVGDHAITLLRANEGSAPNQQPKLASFRLSDGTLEWSLPGGSFACAQSLLSNALPCIISPPGPTSAIGFINVDSGKVESTLDVPFAVSMLATDGDHLYTGGFVSAGVDDPEQVIFAKGSPADPFAQWRTTVSRGYCEPTGTFATLAVEHGLVWGTIGGAPAAVLRDSDGSSLFDHAITHVTVAPDASRIAAVRCPAGPAAADSLTDVADRTGHLLFTSHETLTLPYYQAYRGGPPPFVTQNGKGIDPTTGETLWQSTIPPDGKNGGRMLVGGVLATNVADGIAAADISSGTPLWSWIRSSGLPGFSALTDGQHLLISNEDGGIDAIDISDGAQIWSTTGPIGQPPELYAAAGDVLMVRDHSIELLHSTGLPTKIPNITGAQQNTADRASRMVTKCGQAPQFIPEQVLAESGELVIRMKIVAHCPGGDVLAAQWTRLTVTSPTGTLASGVFDLSAHPITIGRATGNSSELPFVDLSFRFPMGTFWPFTSGGATAAESGARQAAGVDVSTLVVACDQPGATATSAAPDTSTLEHAAKTPGEASSGLSQITFEAMRDFTMSYYAELPDNVESAWSKLDPHLANRSGHIDYVDFWSAIESVTVLSVTPHDDTSVIAHLQYRRRDGVTESEDRWLSFTSDGSAMHIYDSARVG